MESTLVALLAILLGCLVVIVYAVREKRLEMLGLLFAAIIIPLLAVRVFSLRVPTGFGLFYLLCGVGNLVSFIRPGVRGRAALATVLCASLGLVFIPLSTVDLLTFLGGAMVFLIAALLSPLFVPKK